LERRAQHEHVRVQTLAPLGSAACTRNASLPARASAGGIGVDPTYARERSRVRSMCALLPATKPPKQPSAFESDAGDHYARIAQSMVLDRAASVRAADADAVTVVDDEHAVARQQLEQRGQRRFAAHHGKDAVGEDRERLAATLDARARASSASANA
jgi:hypothetical protein